MVDGSGTDPDSGSGETEGTDSPSTSSTEGAVDDTSGDDDASSTGQPSSMLLELVESIAGPRIDPTGTDIELAVGMVVVVVTPDDEGIFGLGAIHIGGPPPDETTFYSQGSVTKVFAGLAVADRVEAGDIDPSAPIETMLAPDLHAPTAGGMSITLEDLASHHGGLPWFPSNLIDRDLDGMPEPGIPPCCPGWGYTRADLALELQRYATGDATLDATPGTSYIYSNHGIGLMGLAAADHLGYADPDQLVDTHVLAPLGMTETFPPEEPGLSIAQERGAQGYADLDGDGVLDEVPFNDNGILAVSGTYLSTGRDARLLLRALAGLDPSPLDGAIARATVPLHSVFGDRQIGYVLGIGEEGSTTVYDKEGGNQGFRTFVRFSREPAVGVWVMVNNSVGETNAHDVATELHRALLEE